MSTAVAAPPAAPLPSAISPRQFTPIAPSSSSSTSAQAPHSAVHDSAARRATGRASSPTRHALDRPESDGRSSPIPQRSGPPPTIKVKKEPGSPPMASSRPRPKRLDLSSSASNIRGPQTARPSAPLTSRESAGLAIQEVGLACLSPGFATNDPGMREQLQRSLGVRDQQRQIIEARQKGVKPGASYDASDSSRAPDHTLFGVSTGLRTPGPARRKGPPPGLSIAAPSAAHFANDRVIQSAPLHQTFTGLQPGEYPHSRHTQHGPSGLSQTSHIHNVPAAQTNNRLPPIADVIANERLDPPPFAAGASPGRASHQHVQPPAPSPGLPYTSRPREFRSAEEAVHGLSGGRDDLLPKVVHYGGVQPPTPPSPMPRGQQSQTGMSLPLPPPPPPPPQPRAPQYAHDQRHDIVDRTTTSSGNGKRRTRDEYERDHDSSPAAAATRSEPKRLAYAVRGDDREDDWRASMSGAEKREEFLRLCERAWDLFHS